MHYTYIYIYIHIHIHMRHRHRKPDNRGQHAAYQTCIDDDHITNGA